MANWSELPEDVIGLFADRLPRRKDFVGFGCVCRSWRSAAIEAKTRRKPSDLWLVMAKLENDKISGDDGGEIRTCYSFSSDKVFDLSLPELRGRRCWGTQYGWVITLGLDSEYHLFNPLTRARFSLPPRSTFPDRSDQVYDDSEHMCSCFPGNFTLSSDPSDSGESVVVMTMYGGCRELAFASPKDKSWTCLGNNLEARGDVIFFKDRFYYVGLKGTLGTCDINTTEPVCVDIAPSPSSCQRWVFNPYLAEISGDLHIIFRRYHSKNSEVYEDFQKRKSVYFCIYKFNFHTQQWIEVKDIGIHSLFVGNNTTFAISTSEYPELKLKANCIYFTDDDYMDYFDNNFCDMGVYDMGMEANIDPFYKPEGLFSEFSRPFFFIPYPA